MYWTLKPYKLAVENLPKKVRIPRTGKQIFIHVGFQKIKKSDSAVSLRPIKYNELNNKDYFDSNLKPPIYPGCENFLKITKKNSENARRCMQNNVTNFVNSNFDYEIIDPHLNFFKSKPIKTITYFSFNRVGKVDNIHSISLLSLLENEIIRILKELPKVTPGRKNGELVSVLYSLPVVIRQ